MRGGAFTAVCLTCLALVAARPAGATNYTYSINVQSSAGSLTGFIVTNTLGSLCAAPCVQFPIVDWNLVVTVGGVSTVLAGPLSGNNSAVALSNNSGSALTATATGLYFNFAETNDQYMNTLEFIFGGEKPPIVCFNPSALHALCTTAGDRSAIDWSLNGIDFVSVDFQGNAQIGSLVPPSVAIQIKPPARAPVRINLKSGGATPVAILSTPNFDATQVDPATISLAGAQVILLGNATYSCSAQDVNGDGLPDLVCQVVTGQLQLGPTSTQTVLTGATFSGAYIQGAEAVQVVTH